DLAFSLPPFPVEVAGLDEAGSGPVMGPRVLCGLVVEEGVLEEMKGMGVRDSKLLSPARRERLAPLILSLCKKVRLVELQPAEIDASLQKGMNLNELEAREFARILNELKPEVAYVDSPDPNPELFRKRLERYLRIEVELKVENSADRKYTVVGAASILAKVRRDARLAELKKKYGEVGSGYSHDPLTISFLRRWVEEHGELPPFARKSWETCRRLRRP
ncbi:MAG: ribonuclease HII, partial [Candidatus Hadarchaeales archaeon]